ncbi:MAG: hypothetical protein AAGE52_10925 [Myxococcota bacterium]
MRIAAYMLVLSACQTPSQTAPSPTTGGENEAQLDAQLEAQLAATMAADTEPGAETDAGNEDAAEPYRLTAEADLAIPFRTAPRVPELTPRDITRIVAGLRIGEAEQHHATRCSYHDHIAEAHRDDIPNLTDNHRCIYFFELREALKSAGEFRWVSFYEDPDGSQVHAVVEQDGDDWHLVARFEHDNFQCVSPRDTRGRRWLVCAVDAGSNQCPVARRLEVAAWDEHTSPVEGFSENPCDALRIERAEDLDEDGDDDLVVAVGDQHLTVEHVAPGHFVWRP